MNSSSTVIPVSCPRLCYWTGEHRRAAPLFCLFQAKIPAGTHERLRRLPRAISISVVSGAHLRASQVPSCPGVRVPGSPGRAGADLLTLGVFSADGSALLINGGRNTSSSLPHFQARWRHDLLRSLVIILSYPIMFFKVKNARTLLRLHLGILQHLEDG